MLDAVIFDFDGLILDTETPMYHAWRLTFEHFGVEPIPLARWSASIGLHDDDPAILKPARILQEELGHRVTEADIQAVRRNKRNNLLDDQPVMPGVMTLLDEAASLGIKVGIASSSPEEWIVQQLEPRGLIHRFPVVSCAGNGVAGKPDPAVYLNALEALGAEPDRSLALEDSANGATAALAAGMACFVVPNPITRHLDLSHADRVLDSLEQVTLADHSRP